MEGRAPIAHLVACGRLDLDYVGAVVGEDLSAIGAAEHAREVDHAQSGHRAGSKLRVHQCIHEVGVAIATIKHPERRRANAPPPCGYLVDRMPADRARGSRHRLLSGHEPVSAWR
jgi:hypothetical protein